MIVPKLRPPRPHSLRWPRSARRHRAAMKPTTVTSRKKKTKTLRATAFMARRLPPVGRVAHRRSASGSLAAW
jgi:hypothetical protein